jgi:hypothetical protein
VAQHTLHDVSVPGLRSDYGFPTIYVKVLIRVWTALPPIMRMKTSGIYEPNIPNEDGRAVFQVQGDK